MPRIETDRPVVIAHRGACGYLPEHTLAAYALAIEMGADFIEPDLVMTKDGVLVARHENEISGTTDIADRREFAACKKVKVIDGILTEGWFTEDFTFAELKTLKAKERLACLRPDNRRFDGIFDVPSFEEVLALVAGANLRFEMETRFKGRAKRRRVGLYPEIKHPTYFRSIGLPMESSLTRVLHDGPFRAAGKVFIQSFEVASLKHLRSLTDSPLVQLLADTGAPYDLAASGDPRTYADLAKPGGLAEIAVYADGVSVHKNLIFQFSVGPLGAPTTLIADAHAAGLIVHGWTFRAENLFLPDNFKRPGGDATLGDLPGEIARYLDHGMDGFFTDHVDIGVRARDAFAMP